MSRPDYLFSNVDWFNVSDSQRKNLKEGVAQLGSATILNTPIEDICDDLKEMFCIHVLLLDMEGAHANQREIDIDISGDRHRYFITPGPHYVKATEVSLTVPFSGDRECFKIQPTQYTSMPPSAEVKGGCLVLKVVGENLDSHSVKANLDGQIAQIEILLTTLRSDAASFNNHIVATVRPLIESRKAKLLADQNLVAELGFPLRPRTSQPSTFAAPSIRRKLSPSNSPPSNTCFKPEPALLSDDYEHIRKVLDGMALVMERSPSAFKNLDEEALRTHFLVQLNGHYEGQATGETFNYQGKTDILVRVDGRNIFIAECK